MGKGDILQRDFKGVFIPKEVWLSSELKPAEKMMWAEINSLDREFGCVANNDHFETVLQLSERRVQVYIKRLKDKGLISVEIDKNKDTRTIRCIGKYARISTKEIEHLNALRKNLIGRWER